MSLPIHHVLTGPRPYPALPLPGGLGLGLARARVHELCGPSRAALAAMLLGESEGTVIWISPSWMRERIYAPGLRAYTDPGRVIFVRPRRLDGLLWSIEEALRSGAAPVVLVDLPDPPGLTPVRRLHLAAEAGAEAARNRGRPAPIGLLLTPGEGGAQGVESRWHMRAAPVGSALISGLHREIAWRLTRLRARMEPRGAWSVTRKGLQPIRMTPIPLPDEQAATKACGPGGGFA
jgi:protein ImuA